MAKISFLVQTLMSCFNFLLTALDGYQKLTSFPINSMLYVDQNAGMFIFSNQLFSLMHFMGVFKIATANKIAT